ncbi:MAG: hypothetical protein K0R54_3743 [Clostridiaceae bacterium]|jgi:transcriptional regulator with AAA-type ATPase domain/transcriptional regulatory protein LevR|nr:hypothetical protein [Clostridiaceae bacterium]
MSKKSEILNLIINNIDNKHKGLSAGEIAQILNIKRSNVSCILNELYKQGELSKVKGKPVLYLINSQKKFQQVAKNANSDFDFLIGSDKSLKKCVQQAKAAILYPPHGLHTLIVGPSGVGKTMFAELMYKFAVENGIFSSEAPFVTFTCSDYANNPQLLLAHLFGCKKGAFTGADKDRQGIVAKANSGVLFLDEVHRLPPEGQEMLFYLIDKGEYTPLGEENKKKCELLVISATTENIDTSLLTTFTRRIPMSIRIPDLKERSLEERFQLICEFFKIEAARTKREIEVSTNTIRQLLLYDCVGNVGQLKSDIQLGCANAFLNSVSQGLKKINVHCTDFATYVNEGLIIYKNYTKEIDYLIEEGKILRFTQNGEENYIQEGDYSLPDNFYEGIEKRIQQFQKKGLGDVEVKALMEMDLEHYFRHFIKSFDREVNKEELSKVVDAEIISYVESFLLIASKKLQKIFSNKVFYGLCLHLSSSVERLRSGKQIINHNLENIKNNNEEEFNMSKELASKIEKIYDIKVPEDEIGFIAMFLTVDDVECQFLENRPIIVIAMHGRATASSMVEVVNKLVAANNIYAYDMSLDKDSKIAYKELKDIIIKKHKKAGVILLVDMGSFTVYGELISEETGIDIKVLDMVSTPIAIECSRKAVIESDINKIYDEIVSSISQYSPYSIKVSEAFIPSEDNIIITLCTTGQGSAQKLKNFIEKSYNLRESKVEVLAMSLNNKQHMYNVIGNLSKEKNILAIVGTINPNIYNIPFISTYDIFMNKNCAKLKEIIDGINISKIPNEEKPADYSTFIQLLQNEISNVDLSQFENLYKSFFVEIQKNIDKPIEYDISVGLMVHMICTISNLIAGGSTPTCYSKEMLKKKYPNELNSLKKALIDMEKFYKIEFSDDQIGFILRNIVNT